MKKGCVIFALNNAIVDYIKLAVFAAERVRNHLEVPVTLITDNEEYLIKNYPNHPFEKVISIGHENHGLKKFNDGTMFFRTMDWKNVSRNRAYDLTPYDKTLVIDSDYIINSDNLKIAFDNPSDLQIYKNIVDICDWRHKSNIPRINQYSIPLYWATAFVFEKNEVISCFFDLVTYIKKNWIYFRTLYSIDDPLYRNDFSFSIAIHIMNGKTNGEFATSLPGSLFHALDTDILLDIKDNKIQALVEKRHHLGEYHAVKLSNTDVHIMNKLSLGRFIDGGVGV
jgi:hypothetical protein